MNDDGDAGKTNEPSTEEADLMQRSMKKQKGGGTSFLPPRTQKSYKDSLIYPTEKLRIRAPWRSALIIKAIGKSVGFKFMDYKVQTLWKLQGEMQMIDLDAGLLGSGHPKQRYQPRQFGFGCQSFRSNSMIQGFYGGLETNWGRF
ncbi:reverse transcriptase [Fagus crenata]